MCYSRFVKYACATFFVVGLLAAGAATGGSAYLGLAAAGILYKTGVGVAITGAAVAAIRGTIKALGFFPPEPPPPRLDEDKAHARKLEMA